MNHLSPSPRLIVWLRRLHVMIVKEWLQLARDLVLLCFIAYAFTVDVYLAGSGVSLQLNRAAFAVHDSDHSFASRELVYRFQPPHFRLVGEVAGAREGMKLLDDGKAIMVLDTPPNFEQSLLRGEATSVQLQVDATHSVLGFLASSYAAQIVGQYGLEAGLAREGLSATDIANVPRIDSRHRVWFNPNQNDGWFMSISELLTVITLFAILLPAAAMVREKERGTVEQLLVSPLTSFQIMFPKVVAMTAVILIGCAHQPGAHPDTGVSRPVQRQFLPLHRRNHALRFHDGRSGTFRGHHRPQSRPGRHDDHSDSCADDLPLRRMDTSRSHACLAANGHEDLPAALLHGRRLRHPAERRAAARSVAFHPRYRSAGQHRLWLWPVAISPAVPMRAISKAMGH